MNYSLSQSLLLLQAFHITTGQKSSTRRPDNKYPPIPIQTKWLQLKCHLDTSKIKFQTKILKNKSHIFHFNIHMHNFISGYAIVQHQPNYIHTHKHTKNHKQFLKMKKKPTNSQLPKWHWNETEVKIFTMNHKITGAYLLIAQLCFTLISYKPIFINLSYKIQFTCLASFISSILSMYNQNIKCY